MAHNRRKQRHVAKSLRRRRPPTNFGDDESVVDEVSLRDFEGKSGKAILQEIYSQEPQQGLEEK